jgi:hypothetical protein
VTSLTHRLKVTGLPSFAAPARRAPRGGHDVSAVCLDDALDALVFRARIDDRVGVWREASGQEPELLLGDDEAGVWLEPVARAGLVIATLARPAGAPAAPASIAFWREGEVTLVDGHSVGVSGDGMVALVVDLARKRLVRVDLADLSKSDVAEIDGAHDPQLAPIVSLDHDGSEALFMDARDERGDASLEGVELSSGARTRLLGPLPAPSRVVAGFAPDDAGVFAVTTTLGAAPRARALLLTTSGERELLSVAAEQPAVAPAFLDASTAVLPFSLKSWPSATYGPVDVTAVALDGRAPVALTSTGDIVGRARVLDGDVIVEGGAALLHLKAQPR